MWSSVLIWWTLDPWQNLSDWVCRAPLPSHMACFFLPIWPASVWLRGLAALEVMWLSSVILLNTDWFQMNENQVAEAQGKPWEEMATGSPELCCLTVMKAAFRPHLRR